MFLLKLISTEMQCDKERSIGGVEEIDTQHTKPQCEFLRDITLPADAA